MNNLDSQLNVFKTVCTSVEDIPAETVELINAINGYDYVVMYSLGGVSIERGNDIKELPEDLLELRAFNEDSEIHVVSDIRYKGRIRKDNKKEGSSIRIFDEEHLLWGRLSSFDENDCGDRITLQEDRGTRIDMPKINCDISENCRITILVRNYLDESNESFEFNDYRFVRFAVREVDEDGSES